MIQKTGKYVVAALIGVATSIGFLILLLTQLAPGPIVAVPLYALKIGDTINIRARVLHAYQVVGPSPNETSWKKVLRNIVRMESRELKNYSSKLEVENTSLAIQTDQDGFVHYQGPWDKPLPPTFQWRLAVDHPNAHSPFATGKTIQPDSFVIVSDLDDTLITSNVGNKAGLAKRIFAKEAWDLKVVPGAAEFLQEMNQKGATIIYLSASPWNVHDQLTQFLFMNGFPEGILILRNFGVGSGDDPTLSSGKYKRQALPNFLTLLHGGQLLLLGDSGEHDPEVYLEMKSLLPSEKTFIAIRNAGGPKRNLSKDVAFFNTYEELRERLSSKIN